MFLAPLANFHRKASVIMVDELLSAYPHQLSFSEAGLRIMITSHFPPKTRLSMASRMLINEVSGKARSLCHWAGVGNLGKGRRFPGQKLEAPKPALNTIPLSHFPASLPAGPAVRPGPCFSLPMLRGKVKLPVIWKNPCPLDLPFYFHLPFE